MCDINVYEVVGKLVGPIDPVGDSHFDAERLQNLETMTQLVERLIGDIADVSLKRNSHMGSVSTAGLYANDFLCVLEASLHEER